MLQCLGEALDVARLVDAADPLIGEVSVLDHNLPGRVSVQLRDHVAKRLVIENDLSARPTRLAIDIRPDTRKID